MTFIKHSTPSEAVSRLSEERAAWLWLLLEPVLHVTYILVIYTAIRVHSVGGIDTAVWVMVGMLAFFMLRRTAAQAMNGKAPTARFLPTAR